MSISRAKQATDSDNATITTAQIFNGLAVNLSQLSLSTPVTTVLPSTVSIDATLCELSMHKNETCTLNLLNSTIYSHRLLRGESNYLTLSEENQQWFKSQGAHKVKVSNGKAIGYPFVILHDESSATLSLRVNVIGHFYLALKDPQEVAAKIAAFKEKNGLAPEAALDRQQNHAIYTQGNLSLGKVVAAGELAFSAQGQLLAVTLESGLFHVSEEMLPAYKASIEKAIRAFPPLADKRILFTYGECCDFWTPLRAAPVEPAKVTTLISTVVAPKPAQNVSTIADCARSPRMSGPN